MQRLSSFLRRLVPALLLSAAAAVATGPAHAAYPEAPITMIASGLRCLRPRSAVFTAVVLRI